jgi:phosphatidate cytidylyltransferase
VTGDMAQPSAPPEGNGLRLRVISAAVILPVAVGALWLGSWWFALLLAVIGGAMGWEWARLCCPGWTEAIAILPAAGVAAPLLLLPYGFCAVLWVVAAGTAVLAALSLLRRFPHRLILIAGLPYVVLGLASAGWLRNDPAGGLSATLWVVASVVATDIGAYFTGRTFKGPKLAPHVSPNKTWSGLIGGMLCAAAVGAVFGLLQGSAVPSLAAGGMVLAAISQGGDLIESKLKRTVHAKDASRLIPGHGGFLDRFDGYLTAMPAAALMSALAGGSPVTWQ